MIILIYKTQLLHTLLTVQVALQYSIYKTILILLTIQVTYAGDTILNTFLLLALGTTYTSNNTILYLHYLLNTQ